MKTNQLAQFTFTSDSCGYMIFANGHAIGGAGTRGTASHTSDGRIRHWRHRRADGQMYRAQAEQICAQLAAGGGPAYLRANLAKLGGVNA